MPLVHQRAVLRGLVELRSTPRAAGAGHDGAPDLDREPDLHEAMEFAQQVMLTFQTAPKYRILNTLYFAFRTADSVLLLTIVVLTLIHHLECKGQQCDDQWKIVVPDYGQLMVFG